jgi:hypothetical protein
VPAVTMTPGDLTVFAPNLDEAQALVMIADALAMAAEVAPCILDEEFEKVAAAKAILRGAILRWHDSGSGAITQVSGGPFQQTVDTRTARRSMFWPTEIADLQKLCGTARSGRAFSVDTTPPAPLASNPLFGALVNGPDDWAPGGT